MVFGGFGDYSSNIFHFQILLYFIYLSRNMAERVTKDEISNSLCSMLSDYMCIPHVIRIDSKINVDTKMIHV